MSKRSIALAAITLLFSATVIFNNCITLAQTKPAMQVGFDDKGLSSIQFAGRELLKPGVIGLSHLDLRKDFPPVPASADQAPTEVSFDAAAHQETQKYPWGSITCAYHAFGDRLMLDVAVHNTTSKNTIFGITAEPLQLRLPGEVKTHGWAHGWPSPSVLNDAPEIFDVAYDGGSIAICNEQVDRPLFLDLQRVGHSDLYNVVMRHDGPPRGQEISAEDSRAFSLSIRFGAAGTSSLELAPDIYKRYAQTYPSELTWDDRRPIGCCFLSEIESRSKTNPTGWLHDSHVDMTTEAGRADWKKRMLARADKSVEVARDMGCQGVIVWDIEGQRMPHAISYIGDPRLMPVMSPEMDPVADAFFKKYTDAGLRCGVTIRPTHVVRSPGAKNEWEHINAEDIVAELAGKIAYARKRWGCTLFYVDSTMRWDEDAEGNFSLHTLPAEFFQSLHRQFPDVLLIPEESSTRHYAYCAPYHEIMPPHNFTITPPQVRAVYPKAFSVIRVADMPVIQKDYDALVESVRQGDVIMFRTWLDDPENVPVKKILEAARAAGSPK
jgi:hypothetical protein